MRSSSFLLLAAGVVSCGLVAGQKTPARAAADHVIVTKKERTLTLLSLGRVFKTYKVALGGDPAGPKSRQGDHRTPEGTYVLDRRTPHSKFYKSIHISYPDAKDRAQARKREFRRVGMCMFTDCRTDISGSG